jgi:hypothetical protein
MSGPQDGESGRQGSAYGRKMQVPRDRDKGGKRHRRHLEEKLRKYEVHAEGYEFIPALMHVLARYVAKVDDQTELDRRMAKALEEVPGARERIAEAVNIHQKIPAELKRRMFSPAYLDLPLERPIDVDEAAAIVDRAQLLRNRAVADLPAFAARTHLPPKPERPRHDPCCCAPETPPSDPKPPPPPPNQYELTFTKLYCVDESDPEWWGSDEPYAVFGVITEEMAETGTAAQAFHTPVYEDVDDGDTRPDSGDENLRIFGFTGPRAINSSVLITASCWENDLGDVSDTTDAVRTALTAVATKAAAAGGVAGWVIAGVAVVGIGVSYLVDLIGADDGIGGTLALSMTEADANATTATVNPAILPPLHFDGGDDDGIYDVYLKLRRV